MIDDRPPQPSRPASACVLCPCRWRGEQWHWRSADGGYVTCGECADRLGTWLRELRDLYAGLDAAPIPGEVGHRQAAQSSRPPARDEVIALTDPRNHQATTAGDVPSVPGVLGAWVDQVRQDRRLRGAPPATGDVAGQVGVLLAHLPWITQQRCVEDFDRELGELRVFVRAAAQVTAGKPPDGQCPTCGRGVWASADMQVIRCRCGAVWERKDWVLLRRMGRPA